MTAALVSQYEGPAAVLRPVTLPALEAHAERFGHAVEIVAGPPGDPGKVLALRAALAPYDVAVWVDADALVLPDAPDLAAQLTGDRWLMLVDDPRGIWNSSVWGLRRGLIASSLLDACDALLTPDRLLDTHVWQQVPLLDRDGRCGHARLSGIAGLRLDVTTGLAGGVLHHGSSLCGRFPERYASTAAALREALARAQGRTGRYRARSSLIQPVRASRTVPESSRLTDL